MFTANSHNKKVQLSFRPEQELEQMDKTLEEALRSLHLPEVRRIEVQDVPAHVRIRQDSGISIERESSSSCDIEPAAGMVQDEEGEGVECEEKAL